MFGAECGCLLGVLVLLTAVFVGLALFCYPTRRKQKELEYMLRQAEGDWKGGKAEANKTWDQQTPE